MPQYDYVSVEVEGNAIDAWQSYTVESDIFTPADAFSLVLGVGGAVSKTVRRNIDYLRSVFMPGTEVKLYCGHGETRALQMVGIVDVNDVRNDATGGTTFNVQGRDKARHLIDNDMPLSLYEKDDTLQSIATKAMNPKWGIQVRGDATLNRQIMAGGISQKKLRAIQQQAAAKGIPAALLSDKIAASIERGKLSLDGLARAVNTKSVNALELYQIRIQDAKPRVGESIWDFLSRHAQRNGALLRMTCDGNLMLMGVDDEQQPSLKLTRSMDSGERNSIISGGERFDLAQSYSRVEVYGKSKKSAAERSAFQGVAEDKSFDASRSYRLGVIRDNSIRTEKDAQKRAEYELALSRQGAHVVEYQLRGHGTLKQVYAVDSVYQVVDDVAGIDGRYYVTSRTLSLSEGTGPVTQVRAVPKGSIVMLGDS